MVLSFQVLSSIRTQKLKIPLYRLGLPPPVNGLNVGGRLPPDHLSVPVLCSTTTSPSLKPLTISVLSALIIPVSTDRSSVVPSAFCTVTNFCAFLRETASLGTCSASSFSAATISTLVVICGLSRCFF